MVAGEAKAGSAAAGGAFEEPGGHGQGDQGQDDGRERSGQRGSQCQSEGWQIWRHHRVLSRLPVKVAAGAKKVDD